MIRIFKLVLLLIVSQVAFGQAPSNYTNINGRYRWIAGMFDSTFHIPKGTTNSLRVGGSTNAGALFYNTTDSTVYTYTGTQWIKLRGVVIDTTSLSNRINLKLNISDTAAMLAPYLRKVDTASLSNRINLKLNISDTATMLGNYLNNVGYGLIRSGQVVRADSATLASYFLRRKDSLTTTNPLGYVTRKILADTAAAIRSSATSGFVPYTGATQNVNLGQFGLTTKFVQFDTSSQAVTDRRLQWSNDEGTLQFGMTNGATITQRIGLEQFARVKNVDATQINKGEAVYIFGASGDRASVKKADNRQDATSSKTLGIAAEDIPVNDVGLVGTFGVVSNLNLNTYTAGDILYLDSIPGGLTKNKPQAPYHLVFIGVVERANSGNGLLFVNPQNGYELEELHNVRITSPVRNNAILVYDSTRALWIDTTVSQAGLAVTQVNTNSGSGITGGPITTVGTIAADTLVLSTRAWRQKGIDSVAALPRVTSVATNNGTGITGGTIVSTGTLAIDTVVISTRAWRQKGIDSVATLANTKVGGSGTANYLSKFTGTNTIANSVIFESGTSIGINTATPSRTLDVQANSSAIHNTSLVGTNTSYVRSINTGGSLTIGIDNSAGSSLFGADPYTAGLVYSGAYPLIIGTNGGAAIRIPSTNRVGIGTASPDSLLTVEQGTLLKRGVRMSGLPTGVGTKALRIDANGRLSIADTTTAGVGTVTSVATNNGTGITGGTITGAGTLAIDTVVISTRAWRQKGIDSVQGNLTAGLALKLNISDTANMLNPYLRKVDTASLSNRINLKVNISDTASMLNPYLRKVDTASLSNRINLKLNISDTASMLSPYLRKIDTASLSNRINTKLNISDTSTMLGNYVNNVGYGLAKSGQVVRADSATLASYFLRRKDSLTATNLLGYVTGKILADTAAAVRAAAGGGSIGGSGTINRLAKFTASGTIGNSSIADSSSSVAMTISSAGTVSLTSSITATQGIFRNASVPAIQAIRDLNVTSVGAAGQRIEIGALNGTTPTAGAAIDGVLENPATTGYLVFNTRTASSLTEKMRLDASGNLGLGVTPSAWGSAFKVFENSSGSLWNAPSSDIGLGFNAYNNGTNWIYKTSTFASDYYQNNGGSHIWRIAPAGTAGNVITFTQAMTLNASGNLGIGTATIGSRLQVNGNAAIGYSASTAAPTNGLAVSGNVTIGTTSTGFNAAGLPLIVGSGSGNTGMTIFSGATGFGSIHFADAETTGAASFAGYINYDHSGNSMQFGTGSNERMRITSGGLVGIGTTSPASLLSLSGSADVGMRIKAGAANLSFIDFDEADSGAPNGSIAYNHGTNAMIFGTGGSNAERMRITSGGDVLVATTTASYSSAGRGNITIGGSSNALLGFQSAGVDRGYIYHTGTDMYLWNAMNSTLQFGTNNTERMRITSGGDVGIGTSAPGVRLHAEASNANVAIINVVGTAPNYIFDVRDDNVSQFRVDASGNIGLSTTTIGSRLQVNGNAAIGYSASTAAPTNGLLASGQIRTATNFQANDGTRDVYLNPAADFGSGAAPAVQVVSNHNLQFATNNTLRMTITNGGNVGLGTNAPTTYAGYTTLAINGTTAGVLDIMNNGTVRGQISGGTADFYLEAKGATTVMKLLTNSAERMRITSGGLVGIATNAPTSTLHTEGSIAAKYVSKTATYTLDATDYTVVFNVSSAVTANLPDATTCTGRIYVIKVNNTTNTSAVTIDPNGAQTIDGNATYTIQCQYGIMIQSDGANWRIIADFGAGLNCL